MAQYTAGSCRLSALASQIDMDNEDVKRQFMAAEQHSSWKQQMGQAAQQGHTMHQVPAYRPVDPAMAAAAAVVAVQQQEQQVALAMQYQAYDYYQQQLAAGVPAPHAAAMAAAAAAQHAAGMYTEPNSAPYANGCVLATQC